MTDALESLELRLKKMEAVKSELTNIDSKLNTISAKLDSDDLDYQSFKVNTIPRGPSR